MSKQYSKLHTPHTFNLWLMMSAWLLCGIPVAHSQQIPQKLECARQDTLDVHPLTTPDDLASFFALSEQLKVHEVYSSVLALKRALNLAIKFDLRKERVRLAYSLLGKLTHVNSEVSEQVPLAIIILEDSKLLPQDLQSAALNFVGSVSLLSGDYISALSHFQKSYEVAGDSNLVDKIYAQGNLADTYLSNQDTATALKILQNNRSLVAGLKHPEDRAYNSVYDYTIIGDIYRAGGKIDSASYYLDLATKNCAYFEPSHPRYEEMQVTLLISLIRLSFTKHNSEHSIQLIKRIKFFWPKRYRLLMAEYHQQLGELEKALSFTETPITVNLELDLERLQIRKDVALALGNFEVASATNTQLLENSETNLDRSKKELLSISKAQMEAFELKHENDIARYEDQIDSLKYRQRTWVAMICILVSLSLTLWFNQQYKKSKQRSLSLSKIVTAHEHNLIVANEQLAAKVKSMERFNHLLSHDLREPLRSISGFASILKRKAKAYKELEDDFDILSQSIDQLTYLMRGVESLRCIEERKVKLCEMSPTYKTDQIVKLVKSKYKDHSVNIDIKGDLSSIRVDKVLFFTSLLEVVDNAAKFCRNKTAHITIEFIHLVDDLVIYVQDDGIGMEPAFKDHIFGLFKRLNRREHYVGSGVGLTLAKLAAEKCMGQITLLESTAGKGSTFQLTFPLNATVAAEIQAQPIQHAW